MDFIVATKPMQFIKSKGVGVEKIVFGRFGEAIGGF
jgi:hypothetical protein